MPNDKSNTDGAKAMTAPLSDAANKRIAEIADMMFRECRNAALEEAAMVCEDMRNERGEFIGYYGNCAAAILALLPAKEK